ncbi:pre-miRNA 5'-monophosphate methyltransferase-like, partial [Petromyzon marinus]|uniref:pre-miRNA 5'-monophosphate methyltransferase-like n=1 Tax=Petromyzon marinus TaxID=7757 RepID=UPI003F6F3104
EGGRRGGDGSARGPEEEGARRGSPRELHQLGGLQPPGSTRRAAAPRASEAAPAGVRAAVPRPGHGLQQRGERNSTLPRTGLRTSTAGEDGIHYPICALFIKHELTVAVYRHLTGLDQPEGGRSGQVARVLPLSVLACDLDADLVERARGDNPHPEVIAYETFDFMDTAARDAALDAFLRRHGRARFDLCLCMSVTMWIHLHHGDAGLRRFLAAAARTATFLLVEPQPWRCYRAAARRLRRLGLAEFPLLPDLRLLRGAGGGGGRAEADELAALLGEEGDMRLLSSLGSTEWGRSLLLFGRTGVALGCIDKSTD